MATFSEGKFLNGFGWLLFAIFLVAAGAVLFGKWVGPKFSADLDSEIKFTSARNRLLIAGSAYFGHAEMRIQQRAAQSVYLYVSRTLFEDIPVPDRQGVLERLKKQWCDSIGNPYYASFNIRDIRTDEELASYSCAF